MLKKNRPAKIFSIEAAKRAERRRTAYLVAGAFVFGIGLGLMAINFNSAVRPALETIAMRASDVFESLKVQSFAARPIDSIEETAPHAVHTDPIEPRAAHRHRSLQPVSIRVIDGDTIRLNGQRPDFRLVGFNAPETRRARCAAEAELGAKATRRLRDLIRGGNIDLTRVACACPPGTEGTDSCNFGRLCGTLEANGRDVADILISEGLAVPFYCGATGCPRMPRPWC